MCDLFGQTLYELPSPTDGLILWCMSHPMLQAGMEAYAIAVDAAAVIKSDLSPDK
jgi:hypothetical protein